MKIKGLILALAVGGVLVLLNGCSKTEDQTSPAPAQTNTPAKPAQTNTPPASTNVTK